MSIILEYSAEGESSKNTGALAQKLEGVTTRHSLATLEQEFDTVTAAKTLATWNTQIAEKKIIPSYQIEELEVSDTEDTYFEGNSRYLTKTGEKIRTFKCFLDLHSHNAIKSYNDKKMRVYEFTDNNEIKAISLDGVKIKGQSVTVRVGKRVDPMADKPAYTPITLIYGDHNELEDNGAVLEPTWSPSTDINGILNVALTLVSASSTSLKFKATVVAGGDNVTSLETADVTLKTALGVAITHSFVSADANGVYELTGTGFANTNKIDLNGVVQQTEATYESTGALSVTGIS